MSEIGIILTSTVIATLISSIATIFNIYYTRKNLKTSTYINVITSERIKWLDIIRNEVTSMITQINLVINNIEKNYNERLNVSNVVPCIDEDMLDVPKSSALVEAKSTWKEQDFIEHLYLLKLRLNPKEDVQIIEIIDCYISFFSKSKYSLDDVNEAKNRNIRWIELIQQLLKDEWDKVKNETRGQIGNKISLCRKILSFRF